MVRVIASTDKKIPVGSRLALINGRPIEDFLEFQFYNDRAITRNVLVEYDSKAKQISYRPGREIGITVETPRYRECQNNCHFCFINGLPAGLRKELYFRDDDYRLSFLFGNFLSLTNIERKDISRIGRLRLSPLYVSVHTTDPALRVSLFKNERARHVCETIEALSDENIRLHCQIVVMPGLTDGKSLSRTIEDLGRMYPAVMSIGVVPVGKTKYAKGVRLVTPKQSRAVMTTVHRLHERFRRKIGCGLVYLADEFYIKTGQSVPERAYYDDLPQYENGIGMARRLLDEIARIKNVRRSKGSYLILTGVSAHPFLRMLAQRLAPEISVDVRRVANDFLGRTVTVSGLMCGKDIERAVSRSGKKYDRVILPPDCVNANGQHLDGTAVSDERVIVSPGTVKELLKCLR